MQGAGDVLQSLPKENRRAFVDVSVERILPHALRPAFSLKTGVQFADIMQKGKNDEPSDNDIRQRLFCCLFQATAKYR